MNVIFFSHRNGKARQFNLSHPLTLAVISLLGLALVAGTFIAGLTLGQHSMARMALLSPTAALKAEQQQIVALRAQVQDRIDALAMRLGTINASIIRLNALGKQLTQMANINSREFDFDHDPPQGGSDSDGVGRGVRAADVSAMIDDVSRQIDSRSAQFSSLESVILGLVSTKTPRLESKDDIKRRIAEAAKYVPLDRLCLSPQCGFASNFAGNPLTIDDERRKLALVVETAREVWGD